MGRAGKKVSRTGRTVRRTVGTAVGTTVGQTVVGAVGLAVLVTGCSSTASVTSTAASASGPSVSVSGQSASTSGPSASTSGPSSSGSAQSAGATPGAAASVSPTPTAPARWTQAALRQGLLRTKDLPAGYRQDTASADPEEGTFTSPRAGCAALIRILKAKQPPGAQASVLATFLNGAQGPTVDEELDGMPTAQAAQAFITSFAAAVKACPSLTLQISGVSMNATVTALPAPALGQKAAAVQLKIVSGPAAGMVSPMYAVATGRVVVALSYTDVPAATAAALTRTAVTRATALGG